MKKSAVFYLLKNGKKSVHLSRKILWILSISLSQKWRMIRVMFVIKCFRKFIHFCLTVSKHSSLTIVELLRYNTVLGVVHQIQKTFYEFSNSLIEGKIPFLSNKGMIKNVFLSKVEKIFWSSINLKTEETFQWLAKEKSLLRCGALYISSNKSMF